MQTDTGCTTPAQALLDIIDLKWLLAGEGVFVHVERLQREAAYARSVLALAAESSNAALQAAARRVAAQLDADALAGA